MSNNVIKKSTAVKIPSKLVNETKFWSSKLKSYSIKPEGVFGSVAVIKSGKVTLKSSDIDFDFTVPFDDDMEANEAEINVYNLSRNTVNNLKRGAKITIQAGYGKDVGVIFSGKIRKVKSTFNDVDKVTTIKCLDDVASQKMKSMSFAKKTKASYILQKLLGLTGIPVAVFKPRKDYTYKQKVTVDGDLRENIKKYAKECGISVYVNKGKIYARSLKEGDNISFTIEPDTGLIGSPEYYEEQISGEGYKETVKGYNIKMLLQHRITTGSIINLKSSYVKGKFRVRSGKHTFSQDECQTEIKVY